MTDLTARQQEIKDAFVEQRGTWSPLWESILRLDPEFLLSYLDFSMVPWKKNHLDAKTKELMYIAVDAAATHLYVPGLKLHYENALGYGATVGELLEVLEIASVIGIHAATTAVPILVEELEARGTDF